MDSDAVMAERDGIIEFRTVVNDGSPENFVLLTKFQQVVRKGLAEMNTAYIARTVLDASHKTLVMIQKSQRPINEKLKGGIVQTFEKLETVIGGVCYRVFENRGFVEMVYVVVSANKQGGGYGAHMMNHFKDEIKYSYKETVMEILGYADLTAVGFFQRQGFTKDIQLEERKWAGVIKDYIKSELMQCTLLPRMRYVEAARMLRKQKEYLIATMAANNKSKVLHHPPAQWARGIVGPIDPYTVPGIRQSGWAPEMDELSREKEPTPLLNPLQDFLNHLKQGKHAWPFLEPVDVKQVEDYYTVVKHPMDLQTMQQKLDEGLYDTPKAFVEDVKLIIKNCRQYNKPNTSFCKNVTKLEREMKAFIKSVPEWRKSKLI
ncbi:uncharacterized protein EAF01_010886 [Botrytis porri]|uniref:histone acetyltransferase n=1 Tax=Botrytis porri TaxID=87229 RepID=A0A4Z1KEF3_9HELO|nr:uncharacterized protein EAF01_010886 [Botrytis porri]KAF7889393.1 hypothetical protein EAF01_010886 [Botrytis porri]TGO84421.1 hypothetical protein BPOR_0506g00030 [Botrytis porri]